ncbi:MAG: biosynthetic arginine decarboxylase [Oligoflexales bacterium]|nr:biosynthetic arginine decarboxylase [Oligoflexales bacterium]
MSIRQLHESIEHAGIAEWGAGYFSIDKAGHVVCTPHGKDKGSVSLPELIQQAKKQSVSTPMIVRFPQIIKSQMQKMHLAFKNAVHEFNYHGHHFGVFPFKVNQRREFIDAIVSCGEDLHWGLEAGSKTEFVAALSYPISKDALFICNGFKDSEFVDMAFIASTLGRRVVLVVEGPDELELIIQHMKKPGMDLSRCPEIGLRVRLYSKGAGKWENSSGQSSKFGLTAVEIMHALSLIEENNLKSRLTMLHFHIGSQITAIKRFKDALREAARVYSKIIKLGFTPSLLNIGGGVGVDYDGSQTSSMSSANYTLQEFANDAVYVIGEVCKNEDVRCPHIVTESGRAIAAYHSVVVTDIREVQGEESLEGIISPKFRPNLQEAHKSIVEIDYILKNISSKNFSEYYHDAVELNDDLFTLFNLGYISLKERAIAEDLFHKICLKTLSFASSLKHPPEEFVSLQKLKVAKYLANFSIFQSIPDSWAVDQLFPILPLSRHLEKPTHKGTIVDITCDSDGCLDRFIDRRQERNSLDLHSPNGEPYYLGFFLVGAYQESLANEHNLFGAIHEVEVLLKEDQTWEITKVTQGDPIKELLICRNYSIEELMENYKCFVSEAVETGRINKEEASDIIHKISECFNLYPYLKEEGVM